MSIAAVVTLPDGIVAVADGRETVFFGRESGEIHDGIDKLQPIGDRIFAVPFGVTKASDGAIGILREGLEVWQDPASIGGIVDEAVAQAWEQFYSTLPLSIDHSDSRLGVALLVAGIAGSGEPFVCESIRSDHTVVPASVGRGSGIAAFRGGEASGASARFKEAAAAIMSGDWEEDEGPHNIMTQALIEAAADTIAHAASQDPYHGWPIRSGVVRHGFPVFKEILRWE